MRRVIISVLLVVCLTSLAIPVFGAEESSTYYYSPLPFDSISLGDSPFRLPWQTNVVSQDVTASDPVRYWYVSTANDGHYYYDSLVSDRPTCYNTFQLNYDSFTLYASNVFVNSLYLRDSNFIFKQYISPIEDALWESVHYKFTVVYFDDDGTGKVTQHYRSYDYLKVYNTDVVDIGAEIASKILEISDNPLEELGYNLQDISIKFVTSSKTSDTGDRPYVQVFWHGSTFPQRDIYDTYIRQYNDIFPEQSAPEEFNLADFITDTVGGFLDFELFPGLSFGQIFYFVLIVGLVLWFITVII